MSLNLGQLTDPNKNPAAIALIDCLDHEAPRIYTHGDLDRLANACARGLLRKGLKTGGAVARMGINRAEFLIAYLGIMRAGMVAVPVNYKLAPDTLSFLLQDCQARLAFVDEPRAAGATNSSTRVRSRPTRRRRAPPRCFSTPRARPAAPRACSCRTTASSGPSARAS